MFSDTRSRKKDFEPVFRDKKFKELRFFAKRILECQDRKKALNVMNGIKMGSLKGKKISPSKMKRIKLLDELIKSYK